MSSIANISVMACHVHFGDEEGMVRLKGKNTNDRRIERKFTGEFQCTTDNRQTRMAVMGHDSS